MADVKIRNLDERVVQSLKARAKEEGLSFEEHLRRTLTAISQRRRYRMALLRRIDANRALLAKKYGVMSDSVKLIRADREERERRLVGD